MESPESLLGDLARRVPGYASAGRARRFGSTPLGGTVCLTRRATTHPGPTMTSSRSSDEEPLDDNVERAIASIIETTERPRATYRLQLSSHLTFFDAARLIPYFSALGISHLYLSPILTARAGSAHGYDVVDHSRLNPELGGEDGFRSLFEAAHQRGMGLIVDVVPNHMSIGGTGNHWWMDVLENGPASLYANYFDIDWHPVK